jgi:hypothetical protein
MLKNLLLIAGVCFSLSVTAQKKSYRSYNYAGILEGQSKMAYQVLTTHGFQLGSYFVGLGTGFDNYRKWSLPLFVSGSKYLFPGKNNLFLNANAGTHFVFNQDEGFLPGATASKYVPGFFGELGLAYRLQLHSMKAGEGILFGTYYSYKAFKEQFTVPGNCANPPCANEYEYINYQLNRWAFKVGFVL